VKERQRPVSLVGDQIAVRSKRFSAWKQSTNSFERARLEREVHVGAEVVDPKLLGPRGFGGGLAVEEQDVGLDALSIEDAGRQAQERMNVAFVQERAADDLPCPALEEDIIGHDNRGFTRHVQDILDMLDEVELLVTDGGPEILAALLSGAAIPAAKSDGSGETGHSAVSDFIAHISALY